MDIYTTREMIITLSFIYLDIGATATETRGPSGGQVTVSQLMNRIQTKWSLKKLRPESKKHLEVAYSSRWNWRQASLLPLSKYEPTAAAITRLEQ